MTLPRSCDDGDAQATGWVIVVYSRIGRCHSHVEIHARCKKVAKANRRQSYAKVEIGADDIAGLERRNHESMSVECLWAFSRAALVRFSSAWQKSLATKRLSGSTSWLETGEPCHSATDFQVGVTPWRHSVLQAGPKPAQSQHGRVCMV